MNNDILFLAIMVTAIIIFIPIFKNDQLVVHPIFNLQTLYSLKVLNVACYKG